VSFLFSAHVYYVTGISIPFLHTNTMSCNSCITFVNPYFEIIICVLGAYDQ
jgi:hypothetical protein